MYLLSFCFQLKIEHTIYDIDLNKKNKVVDILLGSWLVQFNVFL